MILYYIKSLYKNWLLVSKITWGIWTTSDKQWKVQKAEIWWDTFVQKTYLSKKYTPSAKTYTEDLSNITFNYLCENSPNYLCLFETISHDTTPLYFFARPLHTFYKRSPSKCKFSDFPLLGLKFTKLLMPFLETRVSFSSNFASLFSVMRYNSSVLFHLNFYIVWKNNTHQSANFQTSDCSPEN